MHRLHFAFSWALTRSVIKLMSGQEPIHRPTERHLNNHPKDSSLPDIDTDADQFSQWLQKAQAGDQRAVNSLLSNYRDYLTAIANRQLESAIRPKVAASDLVQQSMLAIQGNLEQFRGATQSEFQAWIRQILANDIRDAQRKYRGAKQRTVAREHRLDDSKLAHPAIPDNQLTPATDARTKEEAELLRRAMSQLPENYQRVLQLRNWDEMKFENIGQELGCSADAARKLWFRAVQKLETELRQSNDRR